MSPNPIANLECPSRLKCSYTFSFWGATRTSLLDVLCAQQSRPSLLYTLPTGLACAMRSNYSRARAQLEFHILSQCGALYLYSLGGYRLVVVSETMSSKSDCAENNAERSIVSAIMCTVDDAARPRYCLWASRRELCRIAALRREICPWPAIFRSRSLGNGKHRPLTNKAHHRLSVLCPGKPDG